MNYIEAKVRESERKFREVWPAVSKMKSPLSGAELLSFTGDKGLWSPDVAWALDVAGHTDMFAFQRGLALYALACRVTQLKDVFKPYPTVTFRFGRDTRWGEWEQLYDHLRVDACHPTFWVSVQVSPNAGIRHIAVVHVRRAFEAILRKEDRSSLIESGPVPFASVSLASLPRNAVWAWSQDERVNDVSNHTAPLLQLLPPPYTKQLKAAA